MATATLQSFNVFLTERLTAAAVDIFGFVEKTIFDYQEEVYRTKMENERLQRLLDLVYQPELKLHRAGMFVRSHRTQPSVLTARMKPIPGVLLGVVPRTA